MTTDKARLRADVKRLRLAHSRVAAERDDYRAEVERLQSELAGARAEHLAASKLRVVAREAIMTMLARWVHRSVIARGDRDG